MLSREKLDTFDFGKTSFPPFLKRCKLSAKARMHIGKVQCEMFLNSDSCSTLTVFFLVQTDKKKTKRSNFEGYAVISGIHVSQST